METNAPLAGRLYAAAKTAVNPTQDTAKPSRGLEFGKALQESALETLRAIQGAESTVKSGLAGRADAHSVVEALAATELAVETAVTVRDRVVEAYNEILRMPV